MSYYLLKDNFVEFLLGNIYLGGTFFLKVFVFRIKTVIFLGNRMFLVVKILGDVNCLLYIVIVVGDYLFYRFFIENIF